MIIERESMMNDLKHPNYLILRRPVSLDSGTGAQWQGFVKEIKKGYEKAIAKQSGEFMTEVKKLRNENSDIKNDLAEMHKLLIQISKSVEK